MDSSEFDLTFPMLEYGATETPWDLRPLLFRGGAAAKVKHVGRQIAQSELGSPLPERFELVTRLHEHMTDDLAGGGSRFSVQNKISALRRFFAWIDSENVNLSPRRRPTRSFVGPITCSSVIESNVISAMGPCTISPGSRRRCWTEHWTAKQA